MDFPKKQQQSLIPRYLLQYLQDLQISHNDPTAPWGGGGGGGSYTAGDGIEISDEDVISIDDTVALKSDIPSLTGYATETWVTNQGYLVQSDLSDYVTSSELITELDNYVTSTDLATELLNYAELDDIPTKTSDLTNDSGFITSSALTGYATESWVTNQGYSTFSGSYNDLTDKPTIPSSLSGGTWINIDSNNNINVSNPYISLIDGSGNPRVMISSTSDGTAPTFTATYCNITPTGFGIVDKTQGSFAGYSAAYTYYRHRNILVNNKWTLSFPPEDGTIATETWVINKQFATKSWVTNQGYSTFSGSYNDLTNKPTIPTISGNYSADSYWTSININGVSKNIPTSSNFVALYNSQNISGIKTFVGNQLLRFKQNAGNDILGFTAYTYNGDELGNLQIAYRKVGGNTYPYVTLGNWSSQNTKSKLGFRIQPNGSSDSFNFVMPYGTATEFTSNTYSRLSDTTIPCAFTDGTTIVKADATGLVNISSISGGGGGGTTVSGTNDGTNWTSITIGSDTYGIPSGGGGGGSSLAPQIYNFTSSDWSGLTSVNAYINTLAMVREGLDLSTLTAGQTVKIDCIFVRPSNGTSYVHQFTLVIPDGTMATESTDTFQIPGTNQTNLQIEAWMQISNNRIGLFWNNTSQTRYISKVKVYPANA